MKYIKYFETIEEYESWMSIEENAEEVVETEGYTFAEAKFSSSLISSRINSIIFRSEGSPSTGWISKRTLVPFGPRINFTERRNFMPWMLTKSSSP